ncbi:hypothetical protein NQ315_004334 [Exocentrus adspersus]|uniref:MADF domain-containing protein n=1 Tax=Exocentrus adspersus TaxID=1586481 RepID=A0AAV8W7A4_9CUCU|nr:hypothetical protein NQ315_004334 [Exocentrus adspersus]
MARMNVRKLINLVYSQPALWDQKHDDYNNKLYLKRIWEEIGEKMQCTAEGCKLKWRGLRDVYRRELKKYQSRLSNPSVMDKTAPRWFYFKELQFLNEHLAGLENVAESPQDYSEDYFESFYVKNESEMLDEDEDEITFEAEDTVLLSLTDDKFQSDQDEDRKHFADTLRKSEFCLVTDANKIDEQLDKSMKHYRQGFKRSQDPLQEDKARKRLRVEEKSQVESDSDYHFLMSLLPFLRAVPQRRKMYVRTKIQNVFCEVAESNNDGS